MKTNKYEVLVNGQWVPVTISDLLTKRVEFTSYRNLREAQLLTAEQRRRAAKTDANIAKQNEALKRNAGVK
jgi:hypothetical protein